MARALAKIAYANPHVVVDRALRQIEVYDSIADVFVDVNMNQRITTIPARADVVSCLTSCRHSQATWPDIPHAAHDIICRHSDDTSRDAHAVIKQDEERIGV